MSKPSKSSTKSEKAPTIHRPPSTVPSMSPETLRFLRESEAREWIARYQKKIGEVGAVAAQSWWLGHKEAIAKIRGEEGLRSLVTLMEEQRAKSRTRLPGAGAISQPIKGEALVNAVQAQNTSNGGGVLPDDGRPQTSVADG